MKNSIAAHKLGLVAGGALGLWHLAWAILVALGLAKPLLDFVLSLHMIQLSYAILPFSLSMAVGLIIVTSVLGYIVGYVLGLIWNVVHKD